MPPNDAPKSGNPQSSDDKSILIKYIEPAIILSILASIIYIFGIMYNNYYFGKFSFPPQYAEIPQSIFINQLIEIILINISVIMLYFCFLKFTIAIAIEPPEEQNKQLAYTVCFSIMNACIYLLYFIFIGYFELYNDIVYIIAITFLTMLFSYLSDSITFVDINSIYNSLKKIFPTKLIRSIFMIQMLFFFVLFNVLITYSIADYFANSIINGFSGSYQVQIELNASSTSLPTNIFTLIMVSNNCYYLIEDNKSSNHSRLYMLPINGIKSAIITKR